jgi:branched-chain amino acid transport system ATP-binding protein
VLAHIAEVLNLIKKQGQTILLADQHLRFCRAVCDRGYILEKGRVELSASMEEICGDERILSKYLAV